MADRLYHKLEHKAKRDSNFNLGSKAAYIIAGAELTAVAVSGGKAILSGIDRGADQYASVDKTLFGPAMEVSCHEGWTLTKSDDKTALFVYAEENKAEKVAKDITANGITTVDCASFTNLACAESVMDVVYVDTLIVNGIDEIGAAFANSGMTILSGDTVTVNGMNVELNGAAYSVSYGNTQILIAPENDKEIRQCMEEDRMEFVVLAEGRMASTYSDLGVAVVEPQKNGTTILTNGETFIDNRGMSLTRHVEEAVKDMTENAMEDIEYGEMDL